MASETAPAPESNSSNSPPPPSSSSGSFSASLSSPSTTPPASPPPPPSASPPPPPHSPPPSSSTAPPPSSSSTPPPSSSSPPPSSPAASPPPAATSPPPKSSPSEPPPPHSPHGKGHTSPPPPDGSPAPPPPATSATPPPPTGSTLSPPATPAGNSTVPPPSSFTLSPPPPQGLTPPSTVSPPAHKTTSKSPSQSNSTSRGSGGSEVSSSSSSYQTAIIIGATACGIIILALLILSITLCTRRKKRKEYYMYPPPPPHHGPTGEYFKAGVSDWNRPQPGDHVVKLTPPPGAMGTPQGGGGWGPLPVVNTSSEFSSAYSGGPASNNNHGGNNNNNNNNVPMPPPSPQMGLGLNQSNFTYDELAAATGGFSQANLLGQGGFGYVHKGVLPSGKVVAVKSLKMGSGQGEREFQAEVEIISRVHHRHLVSLVGYCIADGQRMLVYEFVPNKTLEFHLHGKGQPTMDWATRLRIALGSAKGLAYLHEDCHPRIIHRDIKAANILLDDKFEAMVADFGLAKLSSDNFTHVSTRVMGTFGYLAPEYASSGKLTEKSDVFSFGVMLLELITGRRPVDVTSKFMEDSLVDWARPLLGQALEDGNYSELVDPRLENNFVPQEMARLVSCAAASIRHSARRRPKMSQIVRALEGDSSLDDLNEGIKPGQSSAYSTSGGSNNTAAAYDTRAYNADMMKFRKMVMSSQDFCSSEYGLTSEYGLNLSASSSDSPERDSRLQMHNQ